MEADRRQRLYNQDRLRQLKNDDLAQVKIFCSHDAIELERMQQLGSPSQSEPIVPARSRKPATATATA
jgi:hypothetical protein